MSSPPLPDLDALSADGLKRLVVQLLARVAALEEENRRLREENARLKKLPKRPRRGDEREWRHTRDYWAEKDEFPAIDLDDPAFVYG